MSQLHDLTALEQSRAVRTREVSAVELTRHYLGRTEELSDVVGAFVTVTPDLALEQAEAVDRRVAAAESPDDLGPLTGCVVPVKDLDLVAGVRCTFGSAVFADFVSPQDAAFVRAMRDAGLIITGKTNAPEFGMPCYTEPDVAPPARTPWDTTRSAGGSSGGAAAAVSAGLASAAQGSDGGGSIRIPASVTGLVGLKPSRGRVSVAPLVDSVGELVAIGPLARTVADAAALLDVMSGVQLGDVFAAPGPPGAGKFLAAASMEPRRQRIGRFCVPLIAETTVHPDCLAAYEAASTLLAELGHEVVDIEPPYSPVLTPHFEAVWATLAGSIPVPPGKEGLLRPLTKYLRDAGEAVTGRQLAAAVAMLRMAARTAILATAGFDALLTPTLAQPPALVGGIRDDDDPARDFAAQKEFTPFTAPFNVSGQPAVSLPLAQSPTGLPIGVQIVGRPWGEADLLSLVGQIERAKPWVGRRPPVW
ncbi:MAG: amidase [Candidatus Nanopelagicales bacterium]|nr:amidase [Candidatus Nanopelagicales bacterium]